MTNKFSSIAVIGAGGLGREIRDAIEACVGRGGPGFAGFLDDTAVGDDVIGDVRSAAALAPKTGVIIAIGEPAVRYSVANRLSATSNWTTVVHPSAVVSTRATVAEGSFVAPLSYVGAGAVVGSHAVINVHSQVGHDASTGAFVTLSPMCALNGGAVVGDGCFLGTAATVGVAVHLGRWSKVAAGARVTSSTGEGHLLTGNPATGRAMFRPPLERADDESEIASAE